VPPLALKVAEYGVVSEPLGKLLVVTFKVGTVTTTE